jgi:hypothetical protein
MRLGSGKPLRRVAGSATQRVDQNPAKGSGGSCRTIGTTTAPRDFPREDSPRAGVAAEAT